MVKMYLIIVVALVNCNVGNNGYQQHSRALYASVSNKSFGQLLDISTKNFVFLKTFNSEFSYIKVWLTDKTSRLLRVEYKINITLVIKYSITYKNDSLFSST